MLAEIVTEAIVFSTVVSAERFDDRVVVFEAIVLAAEL